MADFWNDGSLPSEAELRYWLETTTTLDNEAITRVVREYATAFVGQSEARDVSKEQVNSWVEQQVNQAGTPVPGSEFEINTGANTDAVLQQRREDESRLNASNQALADERSQVISTQVQSYYDQANILNDSGPGGAAALATSIALGVRTDEYGNPIIDPETGAPMGVGPQELWAEISHLRFNMGALAMPGPRRGDAGYTPRAGFTGLVAERPRGGTATRATGPSYAHRGMSAIEARAAARQDARPQGRRLRGGTIPAGPRRFLSPAAAMALLGNMDEDYITQLQQEMWEAGLFEAVGGEGAVPTWGRADVLTRRAFSQMFIEASLNPDETISQMLNRMSEDRVLRQAPPESGPGSQGGLLQLPDFTPQVTSPETLRETIDEIARNLRGEFASDEERESLVKTLQEKEIAAQRKEYDITIANLREQAGMEAQMGGGGGGGGGDIDRFMAALAQQESGGDYNARSPAGAYGKFQIMPANWGPWAERAGLGRNAPRSPGNQEIVARRILMDYFEQFGNWRDVAVAWYSGPGNVAGKRYSTRPQRGGPSISDYANQVMSRFGRAGAPQPGDPGYTAFGGDINDPIERFDPAAEARAILKAQDPVGWEAHEFANRAVEFYSLLGGVL